MKNSSISILLLSAVFFLCNSPATAETMTAYQGPNLELENATLELSEKQEAAMNKMLAEQAVEAAGTLPAVLPVSTASSTKRTYLMCGGIEAGALILEGGYMLCKEIIIKLTLRDPMFMGRTFQIANFGLGPKFGSIKSQTITKVVPIFKTKITARTSWLSPTLAAPAIIVRINHDSNSSIEGSYMGVDASVNLLGAAGIRGGIAERVTNDSTASKATAQFIGGHIGCGKFQDSCRVDQLAS